MKFPLLLSALALFACHASSEAAPADGAPLQGEAARAHCVARGELPDSACTPGAAEPLTREQLCSRSTRERRHVSEATKRAVLASYGVPWSARGGYEVDHRVPLCVGGSNDVANLWAQPSPSYEAKDRVEAHVCRAICAETMTAEEGQRVFLGDWRSAR
jgi:hypothetical protein